MRCSLLILKIRIKIYKTWFDNLCAKIHNLRFSIAKHYSLCPTGTDSLPKTIPDFPPSVSWPATWLQDFKQALLASYVIPVRIIYYMRYTYLFQTAEEDAESDTQKCRLKDRNIDVRNKKEREREWVMKGEGRINWERDSDTENERQA